MEEENSKTNELGFQEMAAILSPLGLYGGTRKMKLPRKPNTMRTMCGSRTGGWSLPCVMSD
jgi:hypothetical protein